MRITLHRSEDLTLGPLGRPGFEVTWADEQGRREAARSPRWIVEVLEEPMRLTMEP